MRNPEPANRASWTATGSTWLFGIIGIMVVVGIVVWAMSDPTNRTAGNPASTTTGVTPKTPPASTPADPATQSSSR